jgi:transposase InsO family protein
LLGGCEGSSRLELVGHGHGYGMSISTDMGSLPNSGKTIFALKTKCLDRHKAYLDYYNTQSSQKMHFRSNYGGVGHENFCGRDFRDSELRNMGQQGQFKGNYRNYSNTNRNSYTGNNNNNKTSGRSSVEKNREVECYGCGGTGHYANVCPSNSAKGNAKKSSERVYANSVRHNRGNFSSRNGNGYRTSTGKVFLGNENRNHRFNQNTENYTFSDSRDSARQETGYRNGRDRGYATTLRLDSGPISNDLESCAFVSRCENQSENLVSSATNKNEESKIYMALFDSGASYHMTGKKELLKNIKKIEHPRSILGFKDQFVSTPVEMGDLSIVTFNMNNEPSLLVLPDVRLDSDMSLTLFSEGLIMHSGCRGEVTAKFTNVINLENDKSVMVATAQPILKWVKFMIQEDYENSFLENNLKNSLRLGILAPTRENQNYDREMTLLYHRRTAHASAKYLRKLSEVTEGVPKFKVVPEVLYECDVCLKAKSTRVSHSKERVRGVRVLEIVNSDMIGPLTLARTGEKYVISIIDDYSLFAFCFCVSNKNDVTAVFEKFVNTMKNRFPNQGIAILRSDSASEYIRGQLADFCEKRGILSDPSNPYTPEQNGRSERYNRTLLEKVRCVLLDSFVPVEEWPSVVQMVSWIINRFPTRLNPQWKTPYEMFYGKKPDLSYLRVPGCAIHVHIDKQRRVEKKFGARAVLRILFGYNSNGVKAINPIDKNTMMTCNYVASEKQNWEDVVKALTENQGENIIEDPLIDHSYVWMYLARRTEYGNLSDSVPATYRDAMNSCFAQKWKKAIDSEIQSLLKNNVWSKVHRSENRLIKNKKLISTRWVFSVKYDNDIEVAKARLVARGFQDKNQYDLCETYSPVINQTVIRWIISFVNFYHLFLLAVDVKTAFLYGELEQDIFISVPQGLEGEDAGC